MAQLIKQGMLQKDTVKKRTSIAMKHMHLPEKITSRRTQLATQNDYPVHQMDAKTAYRKAPIDCDIYMEQARGYEVLGKTTNHWYTVVYSGIQINHCMV